MVHRAADPPDEAAAQGLIPLLSPRILIFSASIGEGHDLPARVLADGIKEEAPGAEVEIVDSLAVVGWLTRRLVMDSSRFHSKWGSRLFDLSYRLIDPRIRASR